MRRQRSLEFAVGTGLLLGPLVYVLTLPPTNEVPAVCESEPAPEVVVVVCAAEQPVVEPAATPEPVVVEPSEPAPELQPAPPSASASPFLFVHGNMLVLSTTAAPEWGTGKLYEPPGEATFRVAKQAALSKLPAELAAQRERVFHLYGKHGKLCTARLGELQVINQYDGWGLDGVLGEDATVEYDGPDSVPAELWREPLWRHEGHWLVAEIISEGRCDDALWARDASLPSPTILRVADENPPLAERRLAQFERSEEIEDLREAYEAWYAELAPEMHEYESDWAKLTAEYPASVRAWVDGADVVHVVEVDFGVDTEGCGDGYNARIAEVELVRGDVFVDTEIWPDMDMILDIDLDGRFEFLHVGPPWDSGTVLTDENGMIDGIGIDQDFQCPC
jgi:hypothetical protein